jgi:large subunit ribosomal protein L18
MGLNNLERRNRIRYGIRRKIRGSAEKPRLSVFGSNKAIYGQLIDDLTGTTIVAANSTEITEGKNSKTDVAKMVGQLIGDRALEKEINAVVFDRGGYRYHGRVKALAEGAREKGLKF